MSDETTEVARDELIRGAGALIIIPTYNEVVNITALLEDLHELVPLAHVLIVDDASPDGTGEVADNLAARDERVHTLHRPGKLGLGTAYVQGFRWALEREEYRRICEMDADFSHQPKQLPDLLAKSAEVDLVLGSRYIAGGGIENWTPLRRLVSRGGTLYARTILGIQIRDLTGGFKVFNRRVLEAIELDTVRSNGYAFQIEMTYRALCKGFAVAEVPILFVDRLGGKSKMSTGVFREAVFMVWWLRMAKVE